MAQIRIAGLDGSLTNFGVALMTLDTNTMHIDVDDLLLFKTAPTKAKGVRSSSDNLVRAQSLAEGVSKALLDHKTVTAFLEVPSGGQSYSAVLGFGIVIGIYASLIVPAVEVSPRETKLASVGDHRADKAEIIEWAVEKYPDAPWRRYKRRGEMLLAKDNEHVADSVAIGHAGIETPLFKQTIALFRSQAA